MKKTLSFLIILSRLLFLIVNLVIPISQAESAALQESVVPHFTQIKTLQELQLAVEQAKNDKKTVMLDLYADWCLACKVFERDIFTDKRVQQSLVNSVLLQIDLTNSDSIKNVEIMEYFTIFGLPSILFFDLQGKELSSSRVTGFMEADKFNAHVQSIF